MVLFFGFGGLFYFDGEVKRNAERLHTLTVNSERILNADRGMTAAVRLAASLESDRFLLNYQNSQDTKYALLDENARLIENERIREALDKLVDIQGEIEDAESEAIALIDEENWADALELVTEPAFQRQKGIYRAALSGALREMIQASQDQAGQANRLAALTQYGVLGMFVFLALIGFLYSREMRRSLGRQSELARNLEEANVNLEQRVLDRTAELDASRTLFKTVLDNMPAVVFLKSPEGRFELVNRQYEERYSVDQETIRGKTLHDLYPKELADKLTGFDREVVEIGGHHEREHTVSKDGADMVFFSVMFPVFGDDGEMAAFGGIELDITDRKKAEQALETKEAQLRIAMENMPGGMLLIDGDMNISVINEGFKEISSLPVDREWVGEPIVEMRRFRGERGDLGDIDLSKAEEDVRELYGSGKVLAYERQNTDGRWIDVKSNPTPEGGSVVVVIDITTLKEKEAELARQKEIVDRTLGNLDQGIMMVDANMCVASHNARFAEMFGLPEEWFAPPANYHDMMRRWFERQGFKQEVYDNMIADSLRREFFSVERPQADGGVIEMRHIPLDGGGFVRSFTDITERKKAERQLAESEERIRTIIEHAADGIIVIGEEGGVQTFSPAAERIFDYSADEVVGRNVDILMPDPMKTGHDGFLKRYVDDGAARIVGSSREVVGLRKDGSEFPMDLAVGEAFLEGERIFTGIVRDITARKAAEGALTLSEERTRLLLESVGEGVFGVDLEGRITFVNPSAEEMLGVPAEEMIGQKAHPLFHHTRADGSHYPVEECWMLMSYTFGDSYRIDDEVLWHLDGTSFPVEYNATPIMREGEKVGAVISFTDITDRKEAEKALEESRERLELALEGGDMGSWDVDIRGSTTIVDPRWCKMLGYDIDEVDDPGIVWRETLHPEDRERVFEVGRAYRAGNLPSYDVEYRVVTKPGETRWMVSKGSMVGRDADGSPLRMVGTVMDITQRKEAESKLTDAYEVITSSIQYASRIQRSILPPVEILNSAVSEHFVLWEPRDTVGGDMYWCRNWGGGILVLLGDCTGHGVPGAFMTLIANGALDAAYLEVPPGDAAILLQRMHQLIQAALGQDRAEGDSDDGLEVGACYLQPGRPTLTFAGARFSLFVSEDGEVRETKGDKSGLGYRGIPRDVSFTNQTVDFLPDALYYMTSDGLIDQIGGEKSRSFGKRRFKELLASVRHMPMDEQRDGIQQALSDWQGDQRRRDDVSVLGFKGR